MPKTQLRTRTGLLQLEAPDTPADRVAEKRRIRKHQVLDVIRRHGPIPRVEIARILGFNLPSVSSLVDELIAEELAIEEKAKKTAIGRRPIPVLLNTNAACVLGIDVGKSSTIGLIMNLGGIILSRLEHRTPHNLGMHETSGWLERFIEEMVDLNGAPLPPLAGIGIALPGLIWRSGARTQPRLEPEAQEIQDYLARRFEVPVLLDNDARMMAYGVMRFGNAIGIDNFVIVNIGYGLGTGLVIGGNIYRGHFGHAGELGQLPLGEKDVPWYTGLTMTLENVASGSGLERMAAAAGLENQGRPMTSAELADAAREGSRKAQALFKRFSTHLGLGLATLLNLLNPQAIILAGRVSRASDIFLPDLRREMNRHALDTIAQETQLIVSDLYENAGPLGTCACILQRIFSASHISVESVV